MSFSMRPERGESPGLDPGDAEAVRRDVFAHAERSLAKTGWIAEHLLTYTGSAYEILEFEPMVDLGMGATAAELFREIASRPETSRAFRIGELRVSVGPVVRRTLAVLERLPEAAGWWLATRAIGADDALEGEWCESEGALDESLGPILDAWLTPEEDAPVADPLDQPFDLRSAFFRIEQDLPSTAQEVAVLVHKLVIDIIQSGRRDGLVAFVFRGREAERWEVRGSWPCTDDDLFRNLASFGSPAQAIAVVQVGARTFRGVTRLTVTVLAERAGGRVEHILPLVRARHDRFVPTGAFSRDLGEPGADGWLGVDPDIRIGITAIGYDDDFGPMGEA